MRVPILTIDFIKGKICLLNKQFMCQYSLPPIPTPFFLLVVLLTLFIYLSNNRLKTLKVGGVFLLSQQCFQHTLGGQTRKHIMRISLFKKKKVPLIRCQGTQDLVSVRCQESYFILASTLRFPGCNIQLQTVFSAF